MLITSQGEILFNRARPTEPSQVVLCLGTCFAAARKSIHGCYFFGFVRLLDWRKDSTDERIALVKGNPMGFTSSQQR